MKWIAHRGGSPEHDIQSLLESLDNPLVDGIECDVRFSLDSVPVVFHDESLYRLYGIDCALPSRTWNQLQQISSSFFSLQEWLLCIESHLGKKKGFLVMIEIKPNLSDTNTKALFSVIREFLTNQTMHIILASFDHVWLKQQQSFFFEDTWKHLSWMCLLSSRLSLHDITSILTCPLPIHYLGLSSEVVCPEYIEEIRQSTSSQPLSIFVFTINDKTTFQRCMSCLDNSHDGVITDDISYILE